MTGIESSGFWAAVSVAFMQGFVGSLHCVGMCGPFVHLLNGRSTSSVNSRANSSSRAVPPGTSATKAESPSLEPTSLSENSSAVESPSPSGSDSENPKGRAASEVSKSKPRISINLIYNLMRSLSYMSVGFFLGIAGKTLNLYVVNSVAAILGALLLLYFGLSFLFPASIPGFHGIRMPGWFNRSIGQLLRGRTNPVENAALMGMVSGLLPCGLLYPAYGLALGTGEPLAGAFIMFVFSLGTYPALMVVGLASSKLWDFLRARWPGRILGIAMILYAAFIVFKRWSHAGQF